MNLILAGTKSFGTAVLNQLIFDGHWIDAVVAPAGDRLASEAAIRGLFVAERCDKELVERHRPDLIIAAHSHAFIGRRARNYAKLGAIGYHPSLLPRHRGRDAVRWTVHMRDPVAGGTVYWLTDQVDGGPIAAQAHLLVPPGWDHHQLWRALFGLGLRLFAEVLDDLKNGTVVQIPQDEACATWEPSWSRPPLHRPEMLELGPMPEGYELRRT